MKLTPYKKILKFSKEKIQDALAPIRANQAKKQCELELAKMDEKIATSEANIQEVCSEHPLDIHKLLNAQDDLAILERKRKQLNKIIDELFDTEDKED